MRKTSKASFEATENCKDGIFSIIEGTITVHDIMEPKKHETFEHFCEVETDSAWCIPENYDKELGPWRYRHLTNSRLPWHYFFDYTIHDIHEVNDQKQTVTFDMYFKIKWFAPWFVDVTG